MFVNTASDNPCDLVLFGALGDLACRKLLPALYQLEHADLLHSSVQIIACGRDPFSVADYIQIIHSKLQQFLIQDLDESVWLRLSARFVYCQLDLNQITEYQKLKEWITSSTKVTIYYFAIPPTLYPKVCAGLSQFGLINSLSRVVLEKPIGQDLVSSLKINNQVADFFTEEQIYRIDHYLGKETVLNLLVLRFANSIFSSHWDGRVIDKVEISVAEEIGVEGRWNYYDSAGQVRDMLQNHLLQILSLIAMEPPLDLSAESIRTEKLKVLKSLRFIQRHNVRDFTVRGQYTSSADQTLNGYLHEKGADAVSNTETFVAVRAHIDNWRWSGVPFYLLTGKRLAKKQSEVVIYFKPQPHDIFKQLQQELTPNKLVIRLHTDEGIELSMMSKTPGIGESMRLQNSKLDLNFNHLSTNGRIADAYERLLLEVMLGNQYLFVSREEIEQAWRWIDSIKEAWEEDQTPLYIYPSATWGPAEAVSLFNGQAHIWDEQNETA